MDKIGQDADEYVSQFSDNLLAREWKCSELRTLLHKAFLMGAFCENVNAINRSIQTSYTSALGNRTDD